MKNLKPHELLKYAYENYQQGVKFTPFIDKGIYTSSGKFHLHEDDFNAISDEDNGHYIYEYGKWAEIVKPKIAVKVKNEKEAEAICKFKEWPSVPTTAWIGKTECVIYVNSESFDYNRLSDHVEQELCKSYQIIPFSQFAAEHNIKLPHITTHDGVDLFIGDYLAIVWKVDGEWKLTKEHESIHTNTVTMDGQSRLENERKLFSTKQAALDWIEAQKPKEIQYVSEFGIKCQITKEETLLNCSCGCFSITKKDIEEINKALKSL